jgi:hypothetical protein
MTLCLIARLAAGTAAMTLALALHQPLFAGEPEQETASPPASEEAPTDEAAQTARAAMEARRAAHMEQMQARPNRRVG